MADTIQRGSGATQELLSGTPTLEGSEFHPRNTHPVGQGGNATSGTEDIETSPVAELSRPAYEDEGELSGAVRDIKEAAKPISKPLGGLVKRVSKNVVSLATSGMTDEERTRTHNPTQPQRMVKDRIPYTGRTGDDIAKGVAKLTESGSIPTTKSGYSTRKPADHK